MEEKQMMTGSDFSQALIDMQSQSPEEIRQERRQRAGERAIHALRKLEWRNNGLCFFCVCSKEEGHAPGCEVEEILREAE